VDLSSVEVADIAGDLPHPDPRDLSTPDRHSIAVPCVVVQWQAAVHRPLDTHATSRDPSGIDGSMLRSVVWWSPCGTARADVVSKPGRPGAPTLRATFEVTLVVHFGLRRPLEVRQEEKCGDG